MPLKDRGKKLREFININHKLVNSQPDLLYHVIMQGGQICFKQEDTQFS